MELNAKLDLKEEEKQYKRSIWAWTMYDWANSAFATTVMGVVLPTYFATYIAQGAAVPIWGNAVAIGSLIAALLSPILGAMADFKASKKLFMAFFVALGVISTALLWFVVEPADQTLCIVLYILGTIGFAGSLVFYDSLLPHVAREGEIDQVSARGYALGYIGGGLLLLINAVMIFLGPRFMTGMPEAEATALMMRLSLVSVAIWWAVFSIPLFRHVSEPPARGEAHEIGQNVVTVGFKRLGKALSDIRGYKDLFLFLITFFVYANGIGTIITMAAAYGSDLNFSVLTILGTFLMVQFVAAPFSILFGKLGKTLGNKKAISLALAIYAVIAVFGFFMKEEWHMFVLGLGVAMVQGGSQALSRSLIGKMMPKSKSAEFYGFFSVSEKFNTVVGPALMAFITARTGDPRLGIVSLVVFFIAGIVLLRFVNVDRGIAQAEAVDAEMVEL
ncbi:MAG: MFS transporter [Anaerolineaceae bacterium]|nr:MFS transporter [Anaerolineaceae bacterium]MDD4043031.1 MFS transporter [Anaerolineaceae bacterium]MDD4577291.1 MFS transporter [Anaerolineaceae bacterium]